MKDTLFFLLVFMIFESSYANEDACKNLCGDYQYSDIYYMNDQKNDPEAKIEINYKLKIEKYNDTLDYKISIIQIKTAAFGSASCGLDGYGKLIENKIVIIQDDDGESVDGVEILISEEHLSVNDEGRLGEWRNYCGIAMQGFYSPKFKR